MKKLLFFFLINLCVILKAFSQSNNTSFDVTNDLGQFFSHSPFENAYLQFDKPYYAAGDTIYFKAYITEGEEHKPSMLSAVLHINLITPGNKIEQTMELRLDSGLAWGDFVLPDSLSAGDYRVRAYTQLMLNYGEADFFEKTLPVGSLNNNKTGPSHLKQEIQESDQKPDLQFFPEGGSLVMGVTSKVAFKSIDANGSGLAVKGIVLDNDNTEVTSFESIHLGMGYFFLNPEKDKKYKANLTFANGTHDTLDLPKPETTGITLSVKNNSPSVISFQITANDPYIIANRNKNFLLLIYSGGKAITYNFKLEAQAISLDMQKNLLHPGIARITLFSSDNVPLCERLVFIQTHDQLYLQIKSEKKVYGKRENVDLKLNVKDPVDSPAKAHFSVSVVDEDDVPENENNERTILTDLLLTSKLKGYVEQPNYYFKDSNEITVQNLDVLMLTQGYRRFAWKQIMDTNYRPLIFPPEKGLEINGKVTNLSGKPLTNATITLIPSNRSTLLTSNSDDKGFFHFSNLVFSDTTHFVLSAVNSKGHNSTRITYFDKMENPVIIDNNKFSMPIESDTNMSVYLDNAKKVQEEYSHFKGKMLRPVTVRRIPLDNQYRTQSLAGAGNADQIMHANDIERIGGQFSTSLNGRLQGIIFNNGIPFLAGALETGPMIVVMDGVEMNRRKANGQIAGFDVNSIPSSQVETVEVIKYAGASIYGMGGGNGVLIITTREGGENAKDIASVGILPIAPMGFYEAREFYSPKYDHKNNNSEKPDLRSTIYWNPEIKTDNDGNASFDFYNADGTGTYKVTVEGIDDKGNVGRKVYRYRVE